MTALLSAEWLKIRSVRSTTWCVSLTIALSVGLAYLVGLSFRTNFPDLPPDQRATFDPLFATFYSLTIGQLALVVLAVLLVTGEYSTGTIRASLTATPRRGRFYAAKAGTGTLLAAAVAMVTVLATFAAAQAGLGPHATSPRADGVPAAAAGACLYLMLIYLFATGLAALLRNAIPALGILLPLLFLGSQGLGNVPKLKTVTQYLPDQTGMVIMHIVGQANDPRFARPYGPWAGLGLTALWTAAALLAGYLAMRHRDT
ncbi:ABC transporter permease [Rugosimonospora africana]|uniref:ABC transporter n=1 Tax=Rugosimonospora africana TaxID=556532 RepID=A0A8J3QY30_9ACTN|nr:ABC transporter permease [Rugosimonospora africana]GIH19324.1 ABC transporter [Rugosimonospora africana]